MARERAAGTSLSPLNGEVKYGVANGTLTVANTAGSFHESLSGALWRAFDAKLLLVRKHQMGSVFPGNFRGTCGSIVCCKSKAVGANADCGR